MSDIPLDETLLSGVAEISRRAGARILEVYERPAEIDVTEKADASPLTEADLAAHREICAVLPELLDNVPVLSEESGLPTWSERQGWQRYWLVDPLDGTKEFIGRNGEFTVNIALIEGGTPVLGVVHVPVTGVTYLGARGLGAFREEAGARTAIRVRAVPDGRKGSVTVVASRRHRGADLDTWVANIEAHFGGIQTASLGSSLKICLVAEGKADLYPRLAPTSEWDTAAAHAVLDAAGGSLLTADFEPLRYNTKDEMLNPFFVAIGDPAFDWPGVVAGNATI